MYTFKDKIKIIIFGTDTPGGKLFDISLIIIILSSVIMVWWTAWRNIIIVKVVF